MAKTKIKPFTQYYEKPQGGEYLLDLLDPEEVVDDILYHRRNGAVIDAPVGSGKTTFAVEFLRRAGWNRENNEDSYFNNTFFLIDTRAGADRLVQEIDMYGVKNYYKLSYHDLKEEIIAYNKDSSSWGYDVKYPNKIIVMTYHMFGLMLQAIPDIVKNPNKYINGLVCDEYHNLNRYRAMENFEEKTPLAQVYTFLATPKREIGILYMSGTWIDSEDEEKMSEKDYLIECMNCADYSYLRPKLKCLHEYNITFYHDLDDVLPTIAEQIKTNNYKAVYYCKQIEQLRTTELKFMAQGLTTSAIWSLNNIKYPMSEQQKQVREKLLYEKTFDSDVLLINAAYETSIEIKNENVQIFIGETTEESSFIQARGRIRNDIQFSYELANAEWIDSYRHHLYRYHLPLQFFDRPLGKEQIKEIVEKCSFRDSQGHLLKFPTVKEHYENLGYTVISKRMSIDNIQSTYYFISK